MGSSPGTVEGTKARNSGDDGEEAGLLLRSGLCACLMLLSLSSPKGIGSIGSLDCYPGTGVNHTTGRSKELLQLTSAYGAGSYSGVRDEQDVIGLAMSLLRVDGGWAWIVGVVALLLVLLNYFVVRCCWPLLSCIGGLSFALTLGSYVGNGAYVRCSCAF